MTWQRGPNPDRYYDEVMSADTLKAVRERRKSPTGLMHKVGLAVRNGEEVYVYPYRKMELGDFFIAPLLGRSEKAMRTSFKQAAARLDYEFVIHPIKDRQGRDALRVTLTVIGVAKYKVAWEHRHGKKVAISEGKWRNSRKRREASAKADAQARGSWQPVPSQQQTPRYLDPKDWKDDAEPLPVDKAIADALKPERHVDPAEIRRRILAGEELDA